MRSLIIFTHTKPTSQSHCGSQDFLLLNSVMIETQLYTVFQINIPTTHPRLQKVNSIISRARTRAQSLNPKILTGAKDALIKEELLPQLFWVPKSPQQLQRIISLVLKTIPLEQKSLSKSQNIRFHTLEEKTEGSTNGAYLIQTTKKNQKTYLSMRMIST